MTFSEIIEDARIRINAIGDSFYSDSDELTNYANRAVDKLQTELIRMRSMDIAKMVSFTTVATQANYLLNNYIGGIVADGDLLAIIGIWRASDNAPLAKGNLEEQEYQTMTPYELDAVYNIRPAGSMYYVYGATSDNGAACDTLVMVPTPTTAEAHNIWYWRKIPYFNYANLGYVPTWLSEPFHDMISLHMAIRMAEKDERNSSKLQEDLKARMDEYKNYMRARRSNAFSYSPRP